MTEPNSTPEPTASPSPWWLAFRVFDEPGAVFRALAAKPRIWLPMLLMVGAIAVQMASWPSDALERVVRQQMESVQQRNPDRVTDEMIQQRVERSSSPSGRAVGVVTQSIFWAIGLTVAAGILTLVFGAVGSQPIKFKDEMAIVTHSFMPQLLGFILLPLLVRFGGLQEPSLSLGFLFNPDSGFPYALASQFGLFAVWNVILIALGNQIRTGGKSLTGPLTIVGGLWLLKSVIMAALAAALGGMAG